jgi:hypothetical protein
MAPLFSIGHARQTYRAGRFFEFLSEVTLTHLSRLSIYPALFYERVPLSTIVETRGGDALRRNQRLPLDCLAVRHSR